MRHIIAHKHNIQLYGGGAILERIAVVYISLSRMDFGRHMEVASLEATGEMMVVATFP